jgi:hypothetical protein
VVLLIDTFKTFNKNVTICKKKFPANWQKKKILQLEKGSHGKKYVRDGGLEHPLPPHTQAHTTRSILNGNTKTHFSLKSGARQ